MNMKMMLFTAFALLIVAGPSSAQPSDPAASDARWQPWVGCWQLLDESVQDESDISPGEVAAGGGGGRASRANNGTRVCVAPAHGGVTMTTLIGTERALEEQVFADGADHPILEAECRGTKRSEWSKSGSHLFTAAQISCAGQATRNVSSLTMLMPGPRWVDVQTIDIGGRTSIRIRRFQPITDDPRPRVRSSAFSGQTAWTVEDIKEATMKLSPEAVQATLVELGSGFNLSSRQLIALADAKVPESVIDLMIALTYPKKFVVSHPVSSAPPPYGYTYGGLGSEWPWIADADFWPSYYSPFAYRYWGYYDPFYVPSSGYVYVGPGGSGGSGTGEPVGSGLGRVVDGRGYTRVTTRDPTPVPRNNFGGGNNGTMSTGDSGGGSSGVSSGGGYSSGGGGDTGRTAVPRPPGGI
jgi:hypothetical protein